MERRTLVAASLPLIFSGCTMISNDKSNNDTQPSIYLRIINTTDDQYNVDVNVNIDGNVYIDTEVSVSPEESFVVDDTTQTGIWNLHASTENYTATAMYDFSSEDIENDRNRPITLFIKPDELHFSLITPD